MPRYHSDQKQITLMIRDFQRRHGLVADGKDGLRTWSKIIALTTSDQTDVPEAVEAIEDLSQTYRTDQLSTTALRAKYGSPGNESNLVTFKMPYPMYLYGDKGDKMSHHRCHRRIKNRLEQLLKAWLDELGIDYIRRHRLDCFDGVYNNRNTRGGTTKSRHAWGIAIDIDAAHNGNRTPWSESKVGQPGYAAMPIAAINIANRLGWICGATAWGRDAMHFQAD